MHITRETADIQSQFVSYCRTGMEVELPGITPGRINHYRRLVYAVIDDTLEGAFPVTRSFLNQQQWDELVNDFFSVHPCQTPSVWKLPFEFYEYVSASSLNLKESYPFLTDLLYFEWMEIEVHTMPDEAPEKFKENGDWLNDRLILNPEYRLIQVKYPVHQFRPTELIENNREGNYFILIYREQDTGNVQFVDLSLFFGYILTQISEHKQKLHSVLNEACVVFMLERTTELEEVVKKFLEQMKQKKFVFGYQAQH